MKNNKKNSIVNRENLTVCPLCTEKYTSQHMLVLEENDVHTTMHLTCESCQSSTIVFVSFGKPGAVSVGIITDMNKEDTKRLFKKESVKPNDVINVYEFLSKEKRDMKDII